MAEQGPLSRCHAGTLRSPSVTTHRITTSRHPRCQPEKDKGKTCLQWHKAPWNELEQAVLILSAIGVIT
jgi:hypothetical protein